MGNMVRSTSFYAHHSAWGSYSSFVLGLHGRGGGFVADHVYPPSTNVYIGYRRGNDKARLLPFIGSEMPDQDTRFCNGSDFSGSAKWCIGNAELFTDGEITRTIEWSTDTWKAGALTFSLVSPFGVIPELPVSDREKARYFSNPAVFAVIEFDNTDGGTELTGVFIIDGMRRVLSEATGNAVSGAASAVRCGFATRPHPHVSEIIHSEALNTAFAHIDEKRRHGTEGGLAFRVPAGKKERFVIALASYRDGHATSGIDARYYYSTVFAGLEDVLDYSLAHTDEYMSAANERNLELSGYSFTAARKHLIAASTWSYLANTSFYMDEKGKSCFVVNEGEYRFMNTLDLVVDQTFWELVFSPWTVRNILDLYRDRHSYFEKLKDNPAPAVIGFCHDTGVGNIFAVPGNSAYECPNLTGCFSYMTFEETCNWLLSSALYVTRTGDDHWLRTSLETMHQIFESLIAYDRNNDGVMDCDSLRCKTGAEITTYDSLDKSLGQARNNLYLATKTWATYLALAKMFALAGDRAAVERSESRARACADTIARRFIEKENYIPAVFEGGNTSRIIPAIEALVYPYVLGDADAVSPTGRFGSFITLLARHLRTVLVPGVCIDSVSGGWKLSSTSNNTWMSKIFVNQFVAEKVLGYETDKWDGWDDVHLDWQVNGSAFFAITDQVDSATGKDLGSRLYPRLVTAILWLKY